MGYRSQVALKTTTEGYLLFKRFNDGITPRTARPLAYANISATKDGFYKIEFDWIKWYEEYTDVANFITMMDYFEDEHIPYKFIRLGEDDDDTDIRSYCDGSTPDEILDFEVTRMIDDPDDGGYEQVENPDSDPEDE